MVSLKKRFSSIWSGLAFIVLISDLFLDYNFADLLGLNVSGFTLAIIMWILGGTIARIIFGPDPKKKGKPSESGTRITTEFNFSVSKKRCKACGNMNDSEAIYCFECGSTLADHSSNALK